MSQSLNGTLSLKRPAATDPREVMRQCAADLDAAIALKIGVMDSESRAAAVNEQRLRIMQAVAARLREA